MERFINTHRVTLLLLIMLIVVGIFSGCVSADSENANNSSQWTTNPIVETTNPATENTTNPSTEPSTEAIIPPTTTPTTDSTDKAPSVTFTDVNETVYATGTVNIRSGPNTDSEKIGSLSRGDSVKRIAVGDSGWSRVEYNGQIAYIFTSYLSTTKPSGTTSGIGSNGAGSNGTTAGAYVGPADTSKGVSWDGVSPIIYTYPDGTTGTVPKEGATYESKPGITTTYIVYEFTGGSSVNGVNYCDHCGKVSGDGSGGTCVRWSYVPGDHTCLSCGATVPEHTCHTCDEE